MDGQLKLLNIEGVDAGAFKVEFVLVGVAGRFGANCNEGASGIVGIP